MIKIVLCGLVMVCSNVLQGADVPMLTQENDTIEVKKKEVISAYATSNDIVTFRHELLYNSQKQIIKLNLAGTADREIKSEVMVPRGKFYAYMVDNKYLYVVNLDTKKLERYEIPFSETKSMYGGIDPHLLGSTTNSTIVAIVDYAEVIPWFFSDDKIKFQPKDFSLGSKGSNLRNLLPDVVIGHLFALSGDGKLLLELKVLNNKLYCSVYNSDVSFGLEEAVQALDHISGASFNPKNNNVVLYYNTQNVFVAQIRQYTTNSQALKNFSGNVIKAFFSNDGTFIYIIAKQQSNLFCYKFSDSKKVAELKFSYNDDNTEIVNVVNSPDNEQIFVECSNYDSSHSELYIFKNKKYDLIKFDFKTASTTLVHANEGQRFDVKSDGNLIVYKARGKLHFYDCFLRTKAQDSKGIDRCKAILGFSVDGLLWLRMGAPVEMLTGRKTDADYLLCYKVREKEALAVVTKGIEEKLTLDNCLNLLNDRNIERKNWDKKLYAMIDKQEKSEETVSNVPATTTSIEEQKKSIFKILQELKVIREEQEERARLEQLAEEQKNEQKRKAALLRSFGTAPRYVGTAPRYEGSELLQEPSLQPRSQPTSPTPQPTFVQRMWLNVKAAGQTIFNFIAMPFRWLFGWA